jgi:hypothetical protein
VTETTEPLNFVYRMTNRGEGDVGLDVGDKFVRVESYERSVDGVMEQIGLDMVRKGLQFMGHGKQSAELLCLLALKGDLDA